MRGPIFSRFNDHTVFLMPGSISTSLVIGCIYLVLLNPADKL
jgi:hypothetical protein